jgi:NAD(P)-dependent dehydrogenase (short-subunit alcohol dehydrogenase family)
LNYADQPSDLLTHLQREFAASGPVDVAYLSDGTRLGIQLVRRDVPADSATPPAEQLQAGDVVAVLGGARGITAAVAVALARKVRVHFALFGRSPLPGVEDPELQGIRDPLRLRKVLSEQCLGRGERVIPKDIEALTQGILRGREVQANLAAIKGAGATAEYVVCDVRDSLQFAQALRDVQQRSGPIRAVIHGAGVIEDRLICGKSADSFDRVVETKINPILTLVNELPAEQLKAAIFFASVAGFFGNPGQGDYATANEIVNRLACRLTTIWSGKVVSLNWGPWSGAGMVTPEVARQFAARQIGLVSVAAGQRAALDELRSPASQEVRVVIGDGPWLAEADSARACLNTDGRTRPVASQVRSTVAQLQPSLIGP